MDRKESIVIVGGGASGMAAAVEAARYGAHVLILEKEKRIGKKLLATGNGRCNLTNMDPDQRYYHGQNKNRIESVLKQVPIEEILAFFKDLGITHKVEEAGKVYPYSDQASSVLDVLMYEMDRLNVRIETETKVMSIQQKKSGFLITTNHRNRIEAKKIILATGGKAGSPFGADDSGYGLAKNVGHTIIKPFPAIVQIKLQEKWLKALNGVKWQGEAAFIADGEVKRKEKGEILFTEYGISGPPILQLGRLAGEEGINKKVAIALFPDWTKEAIQAEIYTRLRNCPVKPMDLALTGLLHKKMIPVLLKSAGVDKIARPSSEMTEMQINHLIQLLCNWEMNVSGTLSWQHAQVTAGGIDTNELCSSSMESSMAPGLYLVGEIMDADGDCGGYNLHWAWCTGLIAGKHAAASLSMEKRQF